MIYVARTFFALGIVLFLYSFAAFSATGISVAACLMLIGIGIKVLFI